MLLPKVYRKWNCGFCFIFKLIMDLRVGKNYQLSKKIGSGAFGEIYEGTASLYFRQKSAFQGGGRY